jgi:hypothetical protein
MPIALLLFLGTFPVPAMAEKSTGVGPNSAPIFGPEWTFTNAELLKSWQYTIDEELERVFVHLRKKFKNVRRIKRIRLVNEKIEIELADRSQIFIATDPGVIEVQTEPKTTKQWKNERDFYQKYIFDSMKELGLEPHEREGAGHINIGLRYFLEHEGLGQRFLADYFNYPGVGIALNSLTANSVDAKTIEDHLKQLMTNKKLDNLENLLDSLYSLKLEPQMKFSATQGTHILKYLLNKFVAIGIRGVKKEDQLLENLNLDQDESRFEMRQVRPQQSMSDYIKLIELFEARIKLLEQMHGPIKVVRAMSPSDGWEILGHFADYVEEAGLEFKDYRSLLPKIWQDLPMEKFIRTPFDNGYFNARLYCRDMFTL